MSMYNDAVKVLKSLEKKKTSLKKAVFSSKFGRKKQLFALVYGTLNYKKALEEILAHSNFQKYAKFDKELCMVLVYDYLFGKGLSCGGKLKNVVLSNKTALNAALVRVKIKHKVSSNEALCEKQTAQQETVKYWRVNTILSTFEAVIEHLHNEEYKEVESIDAIGEKQYFIDPHVDHLLALKVCKHLTQSSLYREGKVIIQDKASCMPAFVLNPPKDSIVIDACAAPGNKTSHLSALMNNTGKIFAFDISKERLGTMNTLLKKAQVSNTETVNKDFLKVQRSEYEKVEYMLVDPSCSGSGIVSRMSELTDDQHSITTERLKSLHNFQTMILNHALSFPAVKKVVYSTCSIHKEENEQVVLEVLNKNKNFQLENILPAWSNRGDASVFPGAEKTIRCNPNQDHTNGFFVALFVKKSLNV